MADALILSTSVQNCPPTPAEKEREREQKRDASLQEEGRQKKQLMMSASKTIDRQAQPLLALPESASGEREKERERERERDWQKTPHPDFTLRHNCHSLRVLPFGYNLVLRAARKRTEALVHLLPPSSSSFISRSQKARPTRLGIVPPHPSLSLGPPEKICRGRKRKSVHFFF